MHGFIKKITALLLVLAVSVLPLNAAVAEFSMDDATMGATMDMAVSASCHAQTQANVMGEALPEPVPEKEYTAIDDDSCCCGQCDSACANCVVTAAILPFLSIDPVESYAEQYSTLNDRFNTRVSPPHQRPPLTLFT